MWKQYQQKLKVCVIDNWISSPKIKVRKPQKQVILFNGKFFIMSMEFDKNISDLGAHFLFFLILCSFKIERLLFLKFLKNLAFFDSYFWPFNKSEEKIKVIFVISAIMPPIWNVFIKFRWHDEKLTEGTNILFFKTNPFYTEKSSYLKIEPLTMFWCVVIWS